MPAFVVELSTPVEAVDGLATELARLRAAAAELAAAGADVRYLYSLFIPARRTCLSAIDAPDAATALEMIRRSGLPRTATVLPAVRFDGYGDEASHR